MLKAGKRGAIPAELAPLLDRIGIGAQQWQQAHHDTRSMRGTGTYLGKALAAASERLRRGLTRAFRTWLDPDPLAEPPPPF